jgi:hypothetical protein
MSISHKKTEATRNFYLSGDMCRIVDDRYHIVIFSSCRFRSCYRLVNRNRPTNAYSNRIGLHSRLRKHPRPLTWRLARLKIPITRHVRALSPTSHQLDASVKYEYLKKRPKLLREKVGIPEQITVNQMAAHTTPDLQNPQLSPHPSCLPSPTGIL